jgi:hypothetical protein
MDVLEAIFADFATLIGGLDLSVPAHPTESMPVLIRKGPKWEKKVDSPSHVTISKAIEPEKAKYLAFGHLATIWVIEITMVAPNAGEWLANLATYTLYRQQILALFGPPYSDPLLPSSPYGAAKVYDLRIVPDEFLNRDEMASNIDRWTVKVKVSTAV